MVLLCLSFEFSCEPCKHAFSKQVWQQRVCWSVIDSLTLLVNYTLGHTFSFIINFMSNDNMYVRIYKYSVADSDCLLTIHPKVSTWLIRSNIAYILL